MTESATRKTRSPSYPNMDLEEAISRLTSIYEKQMRYPASRQTFASLMGYSGLHGASATAVSALSKYGLLEGHGDELRVSELGQDLIIHQKGDPEYAAALRQAAFAPVFFQELRDAYPDGLPSDHSLRANLIKRGFNPKAIESAVGAYKNTLSFLENQLSTARTPGRSFSTQPAFPSEVPVTGPLQEPNSQSRLRKIDLPYSAHSWAILQADFPLTEVEWDQMLAVLNAMKPALVTLESNSQSNSQSKPASSAVDVASSIDRPEETES